MANVVDKAERGNENSGLNDGGIVVTEAMIEAGVSTLGCEFNGSSQHFNNMS